MSAPTPREDASTSTWGKAAASAWLLLWPWLFIGGAWPVRGRWTALSDAVRLRPLLTLMLWSGLLLLGSLPYWSGVSPRRLQHLSASLIAFSACAGLTLACGLAFADPTLARSFTLATVAAPILIWLAWLRIAEEIVHQPEPAPLLHQELLCCLVAALPYGLILTMMAGCLVRAFPGWPDLPFLMVPPLLAVLLTSIGVSFVAVLLIRSSRKSGKD